MIVVNPTRNIPTVAPDSLDPDNLPPGHALFQTKDRAMVIGYLDALYTERGARLPLDRKAIEQAGILVTPEIINFIKVNAKNQKRTRSCTSCGVKDMPLDAKFCHKCGTEVSVQVPNAEDELLSGLIRIAADPLSALRVTGEAAARVPEESYMPTAQDMARAVQEARLPSQLSGVPGEPPRPTKLEPNIQEAGQVSFVGRRSTNVQGG